MAKTRLFACGVAERATHSVRLPHRLPPKTAETVPIVPYQPVRPVVPESALVSSVFDQAHGQADRLKMFTKCN